MSKIEFTYEQISALATKLASLAASFNPTASVTLLALLQISDQLNSILKSIRQNDPELWAKVVEDFGGAVAEWEASVARQAQE